VSIFGAIREKIMTHQQAHGGGAAPPQDFTAGILAGAGALGDFAVQQQVDVEQALEDISRLKGNPKLNWRSSIVDLMKLLDLDPSLQNRRELAGELGYQDGKNGSAEMNIWLHRLVMDELEKNGGRVPESLKS